MNRLCNMEPRVMDDEMLKLAVGEQGLRDEARRLAKQEGILFKDVLSLQLDFQNILRIDNLWQFENLQKLQLDNNIIEKIEGLENLTRLVWLDLSFNNIEAIEGLDTLVNLEDLSLFNNRISKIDSLDALVKLQVLSLGNNQIGNMMNIIYLRRFKDLRTLSLSGNPVAEAEDYRTFICAYLPDLVYLDFRHIDDHMKELAEMKHQCSVDELKHQESLMQAQLEDQQARWEELEGQKAAFVEHLNGPFLFDSMYAEDVEGSQLSHLPGVGELVQTYKDKFVIICQNIFKFGLKQQEKRKAELDTFMGCVQEAVQEKQEQGKHKCGSLEHRFCFQMLSSIRDESELTNFEMKMAEHSEDITELVSVLMTLEMQLVEQLEETINMFERNIIDLVGLFVENVQSLMAQCRDLENHHHEKLLEIAISTREKITEAAASDDLPTLGSDHVDPQPRWAHVASSRVNTWNQPGLAGPVSHSVIHGGEAGGKKAGAQALPCHPGAPSGHWCSQADGVVARDGPRKQDLFVDKDTIVNAVGASHDIHLLKIDNREDELVTRVNSWCTHLVDKIHKDEIMRNRRRVKEINQYVDHVQSELDSLECSDLLD
ncbi:dynein regulatory complex subunit 3 [Neophocaena asiaeorientalis asiaeorientalis]|uniref:Dynein regulatory complex subunit 3 n=1 Tax=Neophocaena asiaeorientalis asiaeorientalis TaxID=1706337 RepID=A0A341C3V5_NEOAA|nr:dynein regulatory complex subunit 3 [Neophocaena asiaeorientalis asiaeorientalis]